MVVFVTFAIANGPPATGIAVWRWFGIRVRCGSVDRHVDETLESSSDKAVVRQEVMHPERLRLKLNPRGNNVHTVRKRTLNLSNDVRVEGELENRSCTSRPCELGVDDFIRPLAKIAWTIDSTQDVRTTDPPTACQHRLNDDVSPGPHRLTGTLEGGIDSVLFWDFDDGESKVTEMIEISPFVLESAFLKDGESRITPCWWIKSSSCDSHVQRSEVSTPEVAGKVTG